MSTRIYVTDAPWNAVGDGVTDDTAAINAAIASLTTTGGDVIFPAGKGFLVACINRTNSDGIRLIGEGQADGSGNGAYILPKAGNHAIDVSGSSGNIDNLNIGSDGGKWPATSGTCGILMTQVAGREGRTTKCNLKNLFMQGTWTGFGLMGCGITDLDIESCIFYNRAGYNAPVCFARYNRYGFISPYVTISTQHLGSGDILMRGNSEIHDETSGGTRTSGAALLLFDTQIFRCADATLISSSTTAGAISLYSDDGVPCILEVSGAFSSQVGGPPNYDYLSDAHAHVVYEAPDLALQFAIAKSTGSVSFRGL